MAPLPPLALPDPTLAAADRALEGAETGKARRRYLGMSSIGDACERKLWISYHAYYTPAPFDAATLKRFADGHASEDVLANRLRLVPGLTLMTVDPGTGWQWALSDYDGRFKGHMDGVMLGLIQAPTAWHVWEAKSTGEKKFGELSKFKAKLGEKQALKAWNPVYWTQAQCYMGYAGIDRHYLTACTPGARDWMSVRTEFDPIAFLQAKDKAARILNAKGPLARVSNDPSWFQCRMCEFAEPCHADAPPAAGSLFRPLFERKLAEVV